MHVNKTIHYCWFGNNPLGEREHACIASWKKYYPDWEIIQWSEVNFDINQCDYVREAYKAEKWAFVSDYVRFFVLYQHGGLYFDTDVELIKPIDDLINRGPFMGFEFNVPSSGEEDYIEALRSVGVSAPTVNPGLGLYATPYLDVYGEILTSYENDHFTKVDGTLNQSTVVERVTNILLSKGLNTCKAGIQQVAGVTIYPSDFFNPKNYFTGKVCITENTRSIHHFSMSWHSKREQFEYEVATRLRSRGVNHSAARKVAALARVVRYLDVPRLSRWMNNRRHNNS